MLRRLLLSGSCLLLVLGMMGTANAQGEGEGKPVPEGEVTESEGAGAAADEVDIESLSWEQSWDTGFALYREGAYAEAIPYLQRALKLEPQDPTVRAYLAESYRQIGDEEAAARFAVEAGDTESETENETETETETESETETETGADGRPTEEEVVVEVEVDGDHGHRCGCGRRCVRCGRHLGFGLALAGNALTVGGYLDGRPLRWVSIQGGVGAGDGHTLFWWLQAALVPMKGPISVSLGGGLLGNAGLDYHYRARLPAGTLEYYLPRLNPYVHLGVEFVTRFGFAFGFDLNGLFTFDSSVPFAPVAGLRLGVLL